MGRQKNYRVLRAGVPAGRDLGRVKGCHSFFAPYCKQMLSLATGEDRPLVRVRYFRPTLYRLPEEYYTPNETSKMADRVLSTHVHLDHNMLFLCWPTPDVM